MLVGYHFVKKIKGFTIGGRFIAWAQGTKFSHCSTEIIKDKGSASFIYESVFPKSRKLPLQEWLQTYDPVESYYLEVVDPDEQARIISAAERNVGKRYSILQLVGIGIGLVFQLAQKALDNLSINSKKFLICSEFMSEIQKAQGAKFSDSSDSIDLLEVRAQARKLKGLDV
jgi:hypothetical protein